MFKSRLFLPNRGNIGQINLYPSMTVRSALLNKSKHKGRPGHRGRVGKKIVVSKCKCKVILRMGESKPETEPHSEFAWTQILVVLAFPNWCGRRHCLELKTQSLEAYSCFLFP